MPDIEQWVLGLCGSRFFHPARDVWLDRQARARGDGKELDRKEREKAVKSLVKKKWLRVTPYIPTLQTTTEGQDELERYFFESNAPFHT